MTPFSSYNLSTRIKYILVSILLFLTYAPCFPQETSCLRYIDPTIGNVAPLLNSNRPVVHLPNQMTRVFPIRQDYLDDQITAFPLSALNVITPQHIFAVKPSTGNLTDTCWNRRMTYDYDFEKNQPWYYSTCLYEDDVTVEFTAGKKTGIYRFTFPKGVRKNLLLTHNYENGIYGVNQNNEVTGTEFVVDAHHNQEGKAYMYGVLSGKPQSGKAAGEKNWGKYTVLGPQPVPSRMNGERAWFSYDADSPNVIEFRYAISFISCEQAKENFLKELNSVTFDELKEKGRLEWERAIGQIKVEGGTEAQKRTFYTALYRSYVRMVDISEYGKYYSGYDKAVHTDSKPFYTDDYSWGNFPAMHPLRIILNPQRESEMLDSYVAMYEQSGWMPDYPKHFGDREGMFGFHSSIMFLDAYRKGVRNYNVEKALEGMMKSAEQATMLPSRNGVKGPLEDFYHEKGYYPALRPGETEDDPVASGRRGQGRSAVAITQAHSYDDWAISELAKELGKETAYKKYAPKAGNYKNLWHEPTGLFLPKDKDGNWIEINPMFEGRNYYNENNGWSYLWHVQHDIAGLINLMGGKDSFDKRLDEFFRIPLQSTKHAFWNRFPDMTGMIGQFSMGNQLIYFVPYLYNFTASPWKTQKWTRFILDVLFKDNIFGVPGDEDAGALSSFVVFTAMGFYPVQPGTPLYAITSPVFEKVSIALHNGKTFTIIAHNASKTNKYIQSATLNGKPLQTPWFSHDELVNGGILQFEMGEKPGTLW
ncbi:MAG: GH92 family glycosyl hydrolase [Tannerellaceae bacterium]|nr:GH92 family glycosyl hydrolase [Tannerellaceae bacterium]